MNTTIVTGAEGFIGQHLIRHLLEHFPQENVIAVSRSKPKSPATAYRVCDLSDAEATDQMIAALKPRRIYHLAGASRVNEKVELSDYFKSNFITTLNVAHALRQLSEPVAVFLASSVHVYGNQTIPAAEDSPIHPLSSYGFTKYLAEEALRHHVNELPVLSVVVGRLFNCIGPGQAEGFVASDLCRKIAKLKGTGEEVLSVGNLSGSRHFIDVRDAVRFLPRVLSARLTSRFEVFNIASPEGRPISDVLNTLLTIAGRTPKVETSGEVARNPLHSLNVSTDKLQRTISLPKLRPLEETLRDMYDAARHSPS